MCDGGFTVSIGIHEDIADGQTTPEFNQARCCNNVAGLGALEKIDIQIGCDGHGDVSDSRQDSGKACVVRECHQNGATDSATGTQESLIVRSAQRGDALVQSVDPIPEYINQRNFRPAECLELFDTDSCSHGGDYRAGQNGFTPAFRTGIENSSQLDSVSQKNNGTLVEVIPNPLHHLCSGSFTTLSAIAGNLHPVRRRPFNGWRLGACIIALAVALPVVSILWMSFFPTENIWPHLRATVLPRYLITTLWLMLGVGAGVLLLGVPTAWLTTLYDFPGRKAFHVLLLLPLAMPAYVIAYLYTDLLEFAGPVQSVLRSIFGWQSRVDYSFPEIRSLAGAIWMLSLVLYPYVYLMTRSALLQLSPRMLDVSRTLGMSPSRTFVRVVLPIIRPAVAIGVALALMETLNDYGTVSFFSVQTLSAGIYDTWLNMGNLGGAAQIASVMISFVILLILLERLSRSRREFYQSDTRKEQLHPTTLRGWRKLGAVMICLFPVLFGFVIPVINLLYLAITNLEQSWNARFLEHTFNSLSLSITAAFVAVALGVVVAYAKRLESTRISNTALFTAGLGYAIPGVVLAIGLLIPLTAFDHGINNFLSSNFGISPGLILSGSVFAVLMAYVIRFLSIAIGAIDSSMGTIKPSMEMAARSLGNTPWQTLRRFHLPLIRPGILTAFVIVFVDCMKELPATLILRPFNFDTLAIDVFHQAGDEMIELAALGSLVIVVSGLIPVFLLTRAIKR